MSAGPPAGTVMAVTGRSGWSRSLSTIVATPGTLAWLEAETFQKTL